MPPIDTYYVFAGRQLQRVDMGEESEYIMKAIHRERIHRVREGRNTLEAFAAGDLHILAFPPTP